MRRFKITITDPGGEQCTEVLEYTSFIKAALESEAKVRFANKALGELLAVSALGLKPGRVVGVEETEEALRECELGSHELGEKSPCQS